MAIQVWEPRYRDMAVLVARFKIPAGGDINVEIMRGARKGLYHVTNESICSSPIEFMQTKSGKKLEMRAIPFSKLERIEDEYF